MDERMPFLADRQRSHDESGSVGDLEIKTIL
jgi:hypothetical protein